MSMWGVKRGKRDILRVIGRFRYDGVWGWGRPGDSAGGGGSGVRRGGHGVGDGELGGGGGESGIQSEPGMLG